MRRKRLAIFTARVLATLPLPTMSALAAPPANDDFAGSVVIDPAALPFTDSLDTTEATNAGVDLEAGPLCVGPPQPTPACGYSITPTDDTTVFVNLEGTDCSAGVLVHAGDAGSPALESHTSRLTETRQ